MASVTLDSSFNLFVFHLINMAIINIVFHLINMAMTHYTYTFGGQKCGQNWPGLGGSLL